MGQEILYCYKCNAQIRSRDFEKGTALRIQERACCAQCAPALLMELPPKERAEFFKQRLGPERKPPQDATPSRPMSPSTVRRLLADIGPPPKRFGVRIAGPAVGGAALLGLVLVLSLLGRGKPSARPPFPEPPLSAPKPVEPPRRPEGGAPAPTREELRREEAASKLREIQAAERSGRFAPDEIRRRYGEFAREYPDTPQGRTIAEWLVAGEAERLKPAEPKPEPPKIGEPPKPEGAKPPEPPEPEPAPAAKPPEPVPPPPPPKPVRAAVPEASKIKEAEAGVRKEFMIEKARSPEEKAAAARELLKAAANPGAAEAHRFACLALARDLFAQASDADSAMQAVDAMAAAFEIDAFREKAAVLTETPVKDPDAAAWAKACLRFSEQAEEGGNIEVAVRLAGRAERLAAAVKDQALLAAARERFKETQELHRLEAHFKALEKNPDDPAANAAAGKFLCLVKDEWTKGLPMLAKGNDFNLKRLAAQEMADPKEARAQAALGEGWAAQAAREVGGYRAGAKARAAAWLERAIPGLAGPAKVSAQKALASLGPLPAPRTESFREPPPRWKAFRSEEAGHRYGFHPGAEAGGEPGEIGGTFARSGASYYADTSIKEITLAAPLKFSGRLAVPRTSNPDCEIRLGYFDRKSVEEKTTGTFIGISINEGKKKGVLFNALPLIKPVPHTAAFEDLICGLPPFELPGGKYRFELEWTPTAQAGGVLEMRLSDAEGRPVGSRKVEVPQGRLSGAATLDAFGFHTPKMTTRTNATVDVFADDLQYTGRRP